MFFELVRVCCGGLSDHVLVFFAKASWTDETFPASMAFTSLELHHSNAKVINGHIEFDRHNFCVLDETVKKLPHGTLCVVSFFLRLTFWCINDAPSFGKISVKTEQGSVGYSAGRAVALTTLFQW